MDIEKILEEFSVNVKLGGIFDKYLKNKYTKVIFFVLDNRSSLEKRYKIYKAKYVTKDRELIEQFGWIDDSGDKFEVILKPNSFKQIELLFSRLQLESINEGDQLFVPFEICEIGKYFEVNFQNIEGNWFLINIETKDVNIDLTESQLKNKLKNSVERLESLENELGISFEKISFNGIQKDQIKLMTEVISTKDLKIKNNLNIVCTVYSDQNEILYSDYKIIDAENFYGFQIIEFWTYPVNTSEIKSIRLYPQKR